MKKLTMRFNTNDNKVHSIGITEPKDEITGEEVKAVMQNIVDKNIIKPKENVDILSIHDARIVETNVVQLEL